eukprot:scaffold23609_cov122-Cylindrotheca_fusiformis.AAC.1
MWKIALSGARTKTDVSEAINKVKLKAKFTDPIPSSIPALRRNLRYAGKHLRKIRQNAYEERKLFLEELRARIAIRRHSNPNRDVTQALKCLDAQLRSKHRFHKIQRVFNPKSQQALMAVQVTQQVQTTDPISGQQTWRQTDMVIDSRKELEEALLQRNQRHFAAAEGTPFTCPPLSEGNSENHFSLPAQLPDGAFPETQAVVDILQSCAHSPPPSWSDQVLFAQFLQEGLNKWRESTATSPSGRHLGLYKALLMAYYNKSGEFGPNETEDSESSDDSTAVPWRSNQPPSTQELAKDILEIIYELATLATAKGFSLHRWTKVVNVMIYKEPGNMNLEKLRVIHLFEADFNLMVGILFGRRAMYHALHENLIHPGQGGRIGGECEDVALTK